MTLKVALFALLTLLGAMLPTADLHADEMRPGLLEIKEIEPGWFEITWKVPTLGDRQLPMLPQLPEFLKAVGPPSRRLVPGAVVETGSYHSDGQSLVGETIAIEGLSALAVDVLLQISLVDGSTHSSVLRPQSPSFVIPERASKWQVAGSYWQMGTIHILEGADHLLFVLALLLIVSGTWQLLKAVTAFTVAHSITLALASLNLFTLPSSPTEAIISLSIVFLAAEIVHKRRGVVGLTERLPWIIAFGFGLFHGLGFAGALAEIGLPEHEVPLALLMFNVGVETGQLLFIAVVLSALWVLRRITAQRLQTAVAYTVPYLIGGIAAFWTIERTWSSFSGFA
jgi:hypothetical protein